jgi:hypothetical protein
MALGKKAQKPLKHGGTEEAEEGEITGTVEIARKSK